MLILALVVFVVGLVLELLGKANFGVPAQILGSVLFVILLFTELPWVAAAFAAFAVYGLIKVLR